VLSDAVDKRIDAITNSALTFQDAGGGEVEDIAALIDTSAFEDMLKTIMQSLMWGRAGGEFDFTTVMPSGLPGFSFTPFPAKHVKVENHTILINDTDDAGIPYDGDDHLLVLGSPRKFGYLLKAAPYAIYKRGGFGDYAQWLELFGMPQRIGKYSAFDVDNRRLLEEAMENAGAAPWIVIPKETEVETSSAGSTGDGAAYNDFRRACNEEILITILGQTLTTMQNETGARSLGEVHQDVEGAKHRSDLRYVQRVLNFTVLPLLEKRGFPVKGGKFVFPESPDELTVADIVQLSDILEIPAKFLHDKYSIPMPEAGEAIARRQSFDMSMPPAGDEEEEEEEPGKKPGKPVKNADSWMGRALRFFAGVPQRGTIGLSSSDVSTIVDIEKLVNKAIVSIFDSKGRIGNIAGIEPNLFDLTNKVLQVAVMGTFRQAGAAWNRQNADFAEQFSTNTAVFAAFKNHRQTTEMVSLLRKDDGSIRTFSEFKAEALKISEGYNTNWLQTEYNTAVRGARMAVNWKKFEQTKRLYPNLEYMPSRAADPRDSHRVLWHLVFSMDDPIWNTIMPPSDWNCLCGVRQTARKVTPIPAGFEWPDTPPQFRNNPGKSAEFVNTKETGYYKDAPDAERSEIENFAIQNL
jgi:hypothetical protein